MDLRRICTAAMEVGDFTDFAAKEVYAIRLLELAAMQGAELVVLPETINLYCGDGPNNPRALPIGQAAFDDLTPIERMLRRARELNLALAFGLFLREKGKLYNQMLMFGRDGCELGRYRKRNPTESELQEGVIPGSDAQPLIDWEGLSVGGAICFDTHFEEVFASQQAAGARLILIPSLWDGGRWLPEFAFRHSLVLAIAYGAWSKIIDFNGQLLAGNGHRSEAVRFGHFPPLATADVNFDFGTFHIAGNIAALPDLLARYGKWLRYIPDEENSVFYLSSLSREFTIADLTAEFGLIPYQQYFRDYRSMKANRTTAGGQA